METFARTSVVCLIGAGMFSLLSLFSETERTFIDEKLVKDTASSCTITHVLSEGNTTADFLVNMGHTHNQTSETVIYGVLSPASDNLLLMPSALANFHPQYNHNQILFP